MKKVSMIVTVLALVSVLCLTWSRPGICADKITIRFAHELGPTHFKYHMANKFKDLVEGRLKGRVEVRVYHMATLFNDVDALDAVRAGNLEMCAPLIGNFTKWTPEVKILSLPYILPTSPEVKRLFVDSKLGEYLKAKMAAKGIQYLGYFYTGGPDGGLMTKKRIVTLDDVKGMKIRVHSPDYKTIVATWGASPVALSSAEVATAIQQGTIDGAVTSAPFWGGNRDVAPYFTINLFPTYTPCVFVTNTTFWKGLPPDIRKVIQQCVDEATSFARATKDKSDVDLVAKYGVKNSAEKGIYGASPNETKEWEAAGMTTYPVFKTIVGVEVYDLAIDFIKSRPKK